jgi:mannan endo-1,4-beta-mannosidase
MSRILSLLIFSGLLLLGSCASFKNKTIDRKATKTTQLLFYNLDKLSEHHILFGHQHATEYGHGWWGEKDRSDVKSVTGSHPAVIGIDFSGFSGKSERRIARYKERLHENVVDTYNRGGVITAAWHFYNPVTDDSFYWKFPDTTSVLNRIKPGGDYHEKYKSILAGIGNWANNLIGKDGNMVPIIFRPFHEFDGGWFWWGKPHNTREDFKDVWRFTVSYLRDTIQVHNFLYAYSPDKNYSNAEEFLEQYPGDEWVDMLGMDNYAEMGRDTLDISMAAARLKIVSDLAIEKNKLAAFTETGLESIPDSNWWTEVLLHTLKDYDTKLSYVLVWRNDQKSATHYYAPFPGHISVPNFIAFYKDPFTLFEKDLKNIYRAKTKW